jgi:hypothetical protein
MADKEKMKQLIWDCQKDIAAYLPPESGISEHELLQMLISRLDGSQAKEALGDDWKGWWPDDDGGDDDGGSPAPSRSRDGLTQVELQLGLARVRCSSDRDAIIV